LIDPDMAKDIGRRFARFAKQDSPYIFGQRFVLLIPLNLLLQV